MAHKYGVYPLSSCASSPSSTCLWPSTMVEMKIRYATLQRKIIFSCGSGMPGATTELLSVTKFSWSLLTILSIILDSFFSWHYWKYEGYTVMCTLKKEYYGHRSSGPPECGFFLFFCCLKIYYVWIIESNSSILPDIAIHNVIHLHTSDYGEIQWMLWKEWMEPKKTRKRFKIEKSMKRHREKPANGRSN